MNNAFEELIATYQAEQLFVCIEEVLPQYVAATSNFGKRYIPLSKIDKCPIYPYQRYEIVNENKERLSDVEGTELLREQRNVKYRRDQEERRRRAEEDRLQKRYKRQLNDLRWCIYRCIREGYKASDTLFLSALMIFCMLTIDDKQRELAKGFFQWYKKRDVLSEANVCSAPEIQRALDSMRTMREEGLSNLGELDQKIIEFKSELFAYKKVIRYLSANLEAIKLSGELSKDRRQVYYDLLFKRILADSRSLKLYERYQRLISAKREFEFAQYKEFARMEAAERERAQRAKDALDNER